MRWKLKEATAAVKRTAAKESSAVHYKKKRQVFTQYDIVEERPWGCNEVTTRDLDHGTPKRVTFSDIFPHGLQSVRIECPPGRGTTFDGLKARRRPPSPAKKANQRPLQRRNDRFPVETRKRLWSQSNRLRMIENLQACRAQQ